MTAPAQPQAPQKVTVPPGMLAITTYGQLQFETTAALLEARAFSERAGIKDVAWTFIAGNLVDKTRNEAVRQMLQMQIAGAPLGWIVFIDGDMTFPPNLLDQLLTCAYGTVPHADIVGGWCPLRGEPYLPTIDLGSGQWEPVDAGNGPIEVIRTGAACVLIKRHVVEKMAYPWFGVRPAPRALDILAEFDNFCRVKMDGRNPFRALPEWSAIEKCAIDDAAAARARIPQGKRAEFLSTVGEDSGFCDKAKALGFRIFVNTDLVLGHVDRKIITVEDHREAMAKARKNQRLVSGIWE